MCKSTIQVVLDTKDLDFLTTLSEKHHLKNNSQTIRLMIARYKGMEDYIIEHKKIGMELEKVKIAIPIKN